MLSIQNCNLVQPNFQAKKSDNNSSFKSHAGLKTGGIVYGTTALMSLTGLGVAKLFHKYGKQAIQEDTITLGENAVKEMKEFFTTYDGIIKNAGKKLWVTIPLGLAVYMGCGAVIDKLTNKKRAQLEEEVVLKGKQDTLKDNKRADSTRNGEIYYNSNIGKKYGALLGAAILPVWKIVQNLIAKNSKPVGIISSVIAGAIGGLVLGTITDKFSNKSAKKYVDKIA